MVNEAESKRVRPPKEKPQEQRDKTMTGGERAETPTERQQRQAEKAKPKEAPIIQKDVT